MDDTNEVTLRCQTPEAAITLSVKNDERMTEQAVRVGFKKNTLKTTYIPVNFPKQLVIDAGIDEDYVVQESDILGFEFLVKNSGFCVEPAAKKIISRLNSDLSTVHSCRNYINDHFSRVKLARKLIYHSMGRISLIYAYGFKISRNEVFEKVKVTVNTLIRATGLRYTTPQRILDQCLGTTLEHFALRATIINGFKQIKLQGLGDIFGRNGKIRTTTGSLAVKNTFMNFFATKWNSFDKDDRLEMLKFTETDQIKNYLKSKYALKYDSSIFDNYYWIKLGE